MATSPPDPDLLKLAKLHNEMANGNPTASLEIAETVLEWLISRMLQLNPQHDTHVVTDASIAALESYLKNPQSYLADKLSLEKYLLMSASGDLANLLKSSNNRSRKLFTLEVVEHEGVVPELYNEKLSNELDQAINRLFTDETEKAVANLMVDGVRETKRYAEILGVLSLSFEDQQRAVKRMKDKVTARLKRDQAIYQVYLDRVKNSRE